MMETVETMADAIVAAHRASLALPATPPGAARFSADAPVYRAARIAAARLGFIEADAECIAHAWQRSVALAGRFDAAMWPDDPADFCLAPWPGDGGFAACPAALGLYAVLPDAGWVGRMARCGVPTLQLRFKSTDRAAIDAEVHAAVDAVRGTGALLFINDHAQAAIDAGAYGVHLGQEDLECADLDAIRAAGLRLGLSSHGYAEMLRADALAPSYLALGAVYPTTLKRMPTAPQGVGRLARYARLLRGRSLVAIGGIDAARLPAVAATGVGSVAVVRALVAAEQPEIAAASLMAALDSARARRP